VRPGPFPLLLSCVPSPGPSKPCKHWTTTETQTPRRRRRHGRRRSSSRWQPCPPTDPPKLQHTLVPRPLPPPLHQAPFC
uniref:Uncharacterized protein n=1 Tax=Aegilops tauschii subsp. strangulata TaxID=200361 RepID=A0A453K3L4_AEGTS